MSDEAIPEDVQRFIALHIESVAKMEALLLLCRNPQQIWDDGLLAKRLYISPSESGKILADLAAIGLVDSEELPGGCFRYQPASSELALQIERVTDIYAKRLVAVTHLIHQRAAPPANKSIQSFADAFKLKKDKET